MAGRVDFRAPAAQNFKMIKLIIFAAWLTACTQAPVLVSADSPTFDKRPALIVIPGYYGTALRDTTSQRRVFITVSELLFGSQPISLFQTELRTPAGPVLEPDGVLKYVAILPPFYSLDVYGELLDRLSEDKTKQIIPFAYDWRQDLPGTAAKLARLVDNLKSAGVSHIDLVAHSMGGLVSMYYLGYGAQELDSAVLDWRGASKIDRVVFFGTPFRGVFSTFRNMSRGAVLSGNHTLFPFETVASYPATFQLTKYEGAHLTAKGGETLPLALDNPEYWQTQEVGLFKNLNQTPEVREKRKQFMFTQIRRAALFSEKIRLDAGGLPPPPAKLKVMNVVGEGSLVVDSAFPREGDEHDHYIFDVDEPAKFKLNPALLFTGGDGTVTLPSAQLPAPLVPGAKVLHSKFRHETLFNDPAAIKDYQEFLR